MKCCSRSTLGVIIGSLNILLYTIAIILSIVSLVQVNDIKGKNAQQQELIGTYNILFPVLIVVCLVMILISALLITGIVKRRHRLMLPWLVLSAIGFALNCIKIVYNFITFIVIGVHLSAIVIYLLLGILGIVVSGLIIWAIFNLYRDIREENVNKPGRVMNTNHFNYHKSVVV